MLLIWLLLVCVAYAVLMVIVHVVRKAIAEKQYSRIMDSLDDISANQVPGQGGTPADTKKQLEQLKGHLDSGLITKEEYKARRKEMLKE